MYLRYSFTCIFYFYIADAICLRLGGKSDYMKLADKVRDELSTQLKRMHQHSLREQKKQADGWTKSQVELLERPRSLIPKPTLFPNMFPCNLLFYTLCLLMSDS